MVRDKQIQDVGLAAAGEVKLNVLVLEILQTRGVHKLGMCREFCTAVLHLTCNRWQSW